MELELIQFVEVFSDGSLLLHQRVICFKTFWEKDKVIMDFECHLKKVAKQLFETDIRRFMCWFSVYTLTNCTLEQ